MRFRNQDNETKGGKTTDSGERPRKLKSDDQPRYQGKSDAEVQADLDRRFGPVKFRR